MGKKLKVTQIRSFIGRPRQQRAVMQGLGLGKLHRTVTLMDTPEVRGMINKVPHLVEVAEMENES